MEYIINWDEYGEYYRDINREQGPEYNYDDVGVIRGEPIAYEDQTLWNYKMFLDNGDSFEVAYEYTLSYMFERVKPFVNYWEKNYNNEIYIEMGFKDIYFNVNDDGIIDYNCDLINDILIKVNGEEIAYKKSLKQEYGDIEYIDFTLDLDNLDDIIITTEISESGNNYRDDSVIKNEFLIDIDSKNEYDINLTNNDEVEVITPISIDTNLKSEEVIFKRIAQKEYEFPIPVNDLFSIEYSNDINDNNFINIDSLINGTLYVDGNKYNINLKNRWENNSLIFYFEGYTYFDLEEREVVVGMNGKYNNEYKGFTLNWDKSSRELIYLTFEFKAINEYRINLSIDLSNQKPLVGEGGKWKIQEKRD